MPGPMKSFQKGSTLKWEEYSLAGSNCSHEELIPLLKGGKKELGLVSPESVSIQLQLVEHALSWKLSCLQHTPCWNCIVISSYIP